MSAIRHSVYDIIPHFIVCGGPKMFYPKNSLFNPVDSPHLKNGHDRSRAGFVMSYITKPLVAQETET